MRKPVTPDMRDPKTPDDVIIQAEARRPETNPTLGVSVNASHQGTPRHRLVTLGDSLSQGFQNGAIFNTGLSYPGIIAHEMGWQEFRYPIFGGPGGGIPLNLEQLIRALEQRFGDQLNWLELPAALLFVRDYLDKIEDYWERGEGTTPTKPSSSIYHNLAVYGWDLRNTISCNADILQAVLAAHPPKDNFVARSVEYHVERSAVHVLNPARDANGKALSPVQAAAVLSAEGTEETGNGDGIETLLILIGANNALGSILTFKVAWSDVGYEDMSVNDRYTVWRPIHFKAELDQLIAEVKKIRARHVILATVPHVTIAPLARGVDKKVRPDSRYFPYYTLPWISDQDFDPQQHRHLTEQEARAIDSAIDQYNDFIADAVRTARHEGQDWYLFELAGLLDRVAQRRYLSANSAARPSWWDAVGGRYELPPELKVLSPEPNSKFFSSNQQGRIQGGLFSLDGYHPTTIAYGIMAQEVIKVMQRAGVKFYQPDGRTERTGEVKVNFKRLIELDTLISQPPRSLESDLRLISWMDANFNVFGGSLADFRPRRKL